MAGHKLMNQIRALFATRLEGCKLFTMQSTVENCYLLKKDCMKMRKVQNYILQILSMVIL